MSPAPRRQPRVSEEPPAGAACGRRLGRHAAGSAMIETVLALPFLMLIFAFVLFFGLNFIRLQKTSSYDRYESWRAQAYAPGPEAEAVVSGSDVGDGFGDGWDTRQLNHAFFGPYAEASGPFDPAGRQVAGDPAGSIYADLSTAFPDDALQRFYQALPPQAEGVAERMYLDDTGGLPRGRQVRLTTSHAGRSSFEQKLIGPVRHRFTRPDGDWRYANDVIDLPNESWFDRNFNEWTGLYGSDRRPRRIVSPSPYIRDFYFETLEGELAGVSGVNPLADALRGFYLRIPAYHGPKTPTRWDRDTGYSY